MKASRLLLGHGKAQRRPGEQQDAVPLPCVADGVWRIGKCLADGAAAVRDGGEDLAVDEAEGVFPAVDGQDRVIAGEDQRRSAGSGAKCSGLLSYSGAVPGQV